MVSRRLFSSCCGPGAQPRSPRTAEAPRSGELRERFGGVPALLSRTGLPAPSPSFIARGFPAIQGWGSSCRPHRGDGAPVGEVGVQHSRSRPRDGQGCAVVGLWGRSAPPPCPPTLGCPLPPSRDWNGRGTARSDGGTARARCTHAAFPQRFHENKTRRNKPPKPKQIKPKTHPKPRTRNTNKKLPFLLNSSSQLGVPVSRAGGCPPGPGLRLAAVQGEDAPSRLSLLCGKFRGED